LGASLFDLNTPEGQNELLQGHLPVEKIRLAAKVRIPPTVLGDGVREI
jgi:hypothetical protein